MWRRSCLGDSVIEEYEEDARRRRRRRRCRPRLHGSERQQQKTLSRCGFSPWPMRMLSWSWLGRTAVHGRGLRMGGASEDTLSVEDAGTDVRAVDIPGFALEELRSREEEIDGRRMIRRQESPIFLGGAPFDEVDGEIEEPTARIIGGRPASQWYPWFALPYHEDCSHDVATDEWTCIADRYYWSGCGGSLVTARHVLTAAHCISSYLQQTPGRLFYEIGSYCQIYDLGDNCDRYSELIEVESITPHPQFGRSDGRGFVNDFAIVTLQTNSTIQPVTMDWTGAYFRQAKLLFETTPSTPTDLRTVGFGATQKLPSGKYGLYPRTLEEVDLTFVAPRDCNRIFRQEQQKEADTITPSMMCASAGDGGDACNGDSGGPLLAVLRQDADESATKRNIFVEESPQSPQEALVLVGVVSWGMGCAHHVFPGVYSRIAAARYWIQSVVGPDYVPSEVPKTGASDLNHASVAVENKTVPSDNGNGPAAEERACRDRTTARFVDVEQKKLRRCAWIQKESRPRKKKKSTFQPRTVEEKRAFYCASENGFFVDKLCPRSCNLCPGPS